MRVLLMIAMILGTTIPAAAATDRQANATSALINEALDRNVTLKLNGVLPDVLKGIEDQTGVRITAADQVYDLLPWGEQTKVTATIENQTLRDALTALARKLGLVWELGQYEVWLKPMPALARLGRRSTVSELQSLELLRTTILRDRQDHMTIQALLDSIDHQLAAIKSPSVTLDIRSGNPSDPQAGFIPLSKDVNVPRDTNISLVLEDLARQSDATWYPWGTRIVVLPKEQQIQLQLDKPITAHFNGMEIGRVLDQLSEAAGVPFQIEPGALQRVPQQYHVLKLDLENAPIRQALEDIRGITGLDFTARPDGVYVWNQNPNSGPVGAADPVVAIVQTKGGLELLLRESEVPADIREWLAHRRSEQIDRLRQMMNQEGFVPSTRPASTQPAHD